MKSVTYSNKTSAIPPLKHNGQIYNKASDKTELLNKIFASNAHVDDGGKRASNLHSKTSHLHCEISAKEGYQETS